MEEEVRWRDERVCSTMVYRHLSPVVHHRLVNSPATLLTSLWCYTVWIWNLIKKWLGLFSIDPILWQPYSLQRWWLLMTGSSTPNRKAVTLLTSWELWN